MTTTDPRIVFGSRCVWWDSIDKIGRTKPHNGIRIPCCPHCGNVLFGMANIEEWWRSVDRYEHTHPGYRKFILWQRGKCFHSISQAQEAYAFSVHKTNIDAMPKDEGSMTAIDAKDILSVVHDKERRALKALMRIYGDDVSVVLNGLHALSARIAIASGIEPQAFLCGVKHHWDFLADAVNGEMPAQKQ